MFASSSSSFARFNADTACEAGVRDENTESSLPPPPTYSLQRGSVFPFSSASRSAVELTQIGQLQVGQKRLSLSSVGMDALYSGGQEINTNTATNTWSSASASVHRETLSDSLAFGRYSDGNLRDSIPALDFDLGRLSGGGGRSGSGAGRGKFHGGSASRANNPIPAVGLAVSSPMTMPPLPPPVIVYPPSTLLRSTSPEPPIPPTVVAPRLLHPLGPPVSPQTVLGPPTHTNAGSAAAAVTSSSSPISISSPPIAPQAPMRVSIRPPSKK